MAVLLTSLALLVACTASRVDRDASVVVSGTVDTAADVAPGNVSIGLLKVADVGELALGSTFTVGTFGAVCLVDELPSVCGDAREAQVGDDGGFSFELAGSDTQGSLGQASDFDLTAVAPRAGGGEYVTSVRFSIQQERLELPPIRFWDAALDVVAHGGDVHTRWPHLPSSFGGSPEYSLRFVDGDLGPGAVVWHVPEASPGQAVDRRLLEDRRGRVELRATTQTEGSGTTLRSTHVAASGRFDGAGEPLSRGVACTVTTEDGDALPLEPCPLTDGALYEPAGFSNGGTVRSAAHVDLGASQPVSLVVARGATGPVTVETSTDARTWETVGHGTGSFVAVTPPRPVEARYVRVRTTNSTDLSNLGEISVWG